MTIQTHKKYAACTRKNGCYEVEIREVLDYTDKQVWYRVVWGDPVGTHVGWDDLNSHRWIPRAEWDQWFSNAEESA